ncbi:MAG TPA: ATP-binding protein [Solirubrobacteraceae bacterium]|nr:ATP-binding protein [Solirubrobacteraceae bacterium]
MSATARPAPWSGIAGPAPRRLPLARPWLPFAVLGSAALLATLAVPVLHPAQFAYPAPSLRVALDTAVAVIGLLATAIVVRGWRDGPRLDRLAIAAGLAVIASKSAVLTTLLAVAPGVGPRTEIAITGGLVGAMLLAVGAFAPARCPGRARSAVLGTVAMTVLALAVAAGPVALALAQRGAARAPSEVGPLLGWPVAALAFELATAVAFALAAIGLTSRGARSGDAFARRLGLAVLLIAFAKINYTLLPPVAHDWVHLGDVLRLLFCVVLLWAAVVEVAGEVAARATERERRRIARDLHDGVAQELAFIQRRAARLTGQPDAADIVVAAERALLDSRWAIEHLAQAPDEPLDRVLARQAAVIAARTGLAVTFAADAGAASASPEVSEALSRILGEAVSNARHGGATGVRVELSADPLRLRVTDDGAGFDPAACAPGFGLGGMRERAALVGAELSVRSDPGAGTEVAVELR